MAQLSQMISMDVIKKYPARGRIVQVLADGNGIVFQPSGTNYELHMGLVDGERPAISPQPIDGLIFVKARKVWTVPSGGNFVSPIFGPPKTIQGRVKWLDERLLVVQAGTSFIVELPVADDAVDLANGGIEVGQMVNVTALPGAMFASRPPG
jgi:hypothetical protein